MSTLLAEAASSDKAVETTIIPYIKTPPSEINLWPILENVALPFLIMLIIIIFITFILRAIVLWYWKVNKIIEILEDIAFNTRKETNEYLEESFYTPEEERVLDKFRSYKK